MLDSTLLNLCKARLGLIKRATDPYGFPGPNPDNISPWSAINPSSLQQSQPLRHYGEAIGNIFEGGATGPGVLGQLTSPITRLPYEAAGQGAALDASLRRAGNPATARDVQRLPANLRLPVRDANEALSGTVNQSAQLQSHVTGIPAEPPAPPQPASKPWWQNWQVPVAGAAGLGALALWLRSRKQKPKKKPVEEEQ